MMKTKRGFTVVELLLVIGIIGILMAVAFTAMSGSSDSARASKCLANLHNLAAAVHAVGMEEDWYPAAGSYETKTTGGRNATYSETKGWVSWTSMSAYKNSPKAHRSSSGWFMSTYGGNTEQRIYSLTNGAIWQAVSGNAASYVCPVHTKCVSHRKVTPVWSYVMNSYFGWDASEGSTSQINKRKWFKSLTNGDRRLLFAELAFNPDLSKAKTVSYHPSVQFAKNAGTAYDATLQYGKNEVIGFNHKDGKKWYAHVCFADGHTEKLELPKNAGEAEIRKLTTWLCEGVDVSYNGSKYEELK